MPFNNTPLSLLELLPPEILFNLLTLLDHSERRALVHASPVLHAVYSANRRFLLQSYLETYFGSVFVDVYAVYQLQMLKPCHSMRNASFQSRVAAMYSVLQCYADNLVTRRLPAHVRLSVAESSYILNFFRRFARPVRNKCVDWSIARMPHRVTKSPLLDHGLSPTEAMRTTRAVYRFQILCLLAGPEPRATAYRGLAAYMLDIIEPWEAAEVLTVYTFASIAYRDVLSSARRDLGYARPGLPAPGVDEERASREGVVLRGLVLLRTVLFDVVDHSQLVSLLATNLRRNAAGAGVGVGAAMGSIGSLFRDGALPEELGNIARPPSALLREELNARRCAFPFRGDGDPTAPPLAWTALWRDTYSNVSAWSVPYTLKIWGWTFWDAQTLQSAGLLQPLKDEWQRRWGNADPRDLDEAANWAD